MSLTIRLKPGPPKAYGSLCANNGWGPSLQKIFSESPLWGILAENTDWNSCTICPTMGKMGKKYQAKLLRVTSIQWGFVMEVL